MLMDGVNIKPVSDILGHTSIRTTLDLYGHVLQAEKEGRRSPRPVPRGWYGYADGADEGAI